MSECKIIPFPARGNHSVHAEWITDGNITLYVNCTEWLHYFVNGAEVCECGRERRRDDR